MKFLAIYALIGLLYGTLRLIVGGKKLFGETIAMYNKACDDNCYKGNMRVIFAIELCVFTLVLIMLSWPYELMRCIKRDFFTKQKKDEP